MTDPPYQNTVAVSAVHERISTVGALLTPLRPRQHASRRPVAVQLISRRAGTETLVVASEQGAGGAGGEKVFRTFAPRLFAEYKEQWIQSGSQWLLSQAMLHVFHVERLADGLNHEIFALHCEPGELGDSTQSLFKRSPHVHIKADRNRLGKAHIPLNYQNLDGVLASADSFGDAFAAAIDVVAIEIVDRLANA